MTSPVVDAPVVDEARRPRRSVFVADTLRPRAVARLDSRASDVQLQGRTLWLSLHGEAHFRSLRLRDAVTEEEEASLARNQTGSVVRGPRQPALSPGPIAQRSLTPLAQVDPTSSSTANGPRGVLEEGRRAHQASTVASPVAENGDVPEPASLAAAEQGSSQSLSVANGALRSSSSCATPTDDAEGVSTTSAVGDVGVAPLTTASVSAGRGAGDGGGGGGLNRGSGDSLVTSSAPLSGALANVAGLKTRGRAMATRGRDVVAGGDKDGAGSGTKGAAAAIRREEVRAILGFVA